MVSSTMIQIGLIMLLVICDLISSSLIKYYHLSGRTDHLKLLGAILVYCIVPIILVFSLNYDGIGNTNLYWNVMSTIFVYLLAVFYFGEKITNLQYLGIFLSIIGVVLIVANSPEK